MDNLTFFGLANRLLLLTVLGAIQPELKWGCGVELNWETIVGNARYGYPRVSATAGVTPKITTADGNVNASVLISGC